MFVAICSKIQSLRVKYHNAFVILGGDFNDAPNDQIDRVPAKTVNVTRFKCTNYISDELHLTDVWRFFHPNENEFTWNNSSRTQKSRIDLWLLSNNCLQFTKETSHDYAPFSDHKSIMLNMCGSRMNNSFRGYWKMNTNLLQDTVFCDHIKELANELFTQSDLNHIQKWELFKFKVREVSIKRSKDIKKESIAKETQILDELNTLLKKTNLTEDDEVKINKLKSDIDKYYVELAKGAFIRSRCKWLEKGEKNSSYFFALEKRNQKRNNITALKSNDQIISNHNELSKLVENFYKNMYKSQSHPDAHIPFIDSIKNYIPIISENFKDLCEQPLTRTELSDVVKKLKKLKSPGNDGLPTEFYLHFWDILEKPLFDALTDCITQNELSSTMKQGTICLIPKPEKDPLSIENWRPITLLNVDYKMLASVYAKRLQKVLPEIISETQTGFMSNRHISSNIRLVLDLLDYSEHITSNALILFLDFYKAFDSIEHNFLFATLRSFGFGESFVSTVQMLYKNINSCIMMYPNTTPRFPVQKSVRQGCPLAPFLFLLSVELLSIYIKNSSIEGITIFNKEIKITQLADDTAIFLSNKHQVGNAITTVQKFSDASGLKLNTSKCEILCLYECNEQMVNNINVKKSVKYLGVYICKDPSERQNQNFLPKLKKTRNIFNLWLQRDTSVWGRTLLSKVEGVSRFVYPALALEINDSVCTEINKIFTDFIWKKKQHRLKRSILTNPKDEGGLETLDFSILNQAFKVKWIKQCISNPSSLWHFIPNNVFQKIGGIHFLLKCNYNIVKLPLKLSAFHKQALLAWKICYKHNFSPHKSTIWNNENIIKNNKSLFLLNWFEKKIIYIQDLFGNDGQLLSYETFMNQYNFPVPPREFNSVIRAIPNGIKELFRSQSKRETASISDPIFIDGVDVTSAKCSNKHIRMCIQKQNKFAPACKSFWSSQFDITNWSKTWLNPFKYCINNKIKETHWKIVHNIYPTNSYLAKFMDIENKCVFCQIEIETLNHLFYECSFSRALWSKIETLLHQKTNDPIRLDLRSIVTYFSNEQVDIEHIVNLFILLGKFHIHKAKFLNYKPSFNLMLVEIKDYFEMLDKIENKDACKTLSIAKQLNFV